MGLLRLPLLALVSLWPAASQDAASGEASGRCEGGKYQCVPYYRCGLDDIIADGAGLLDIRFGGELTENGKSSPTLTHSECGDLLSVCCTEPDFSANINARAVSHEPHCGQRNTQGLDLQVLGFKDRQAQFGEFPWHAAVTYSKGGGKRLTAGGGSLIHQQVVLTAAHSVYGRRNLQVVLGEWDTKGTDEPYRHITVPVSQVIVHPHFDRGGFANDAALLVLEAPVKLMPHIDTLCLPSADFVPAPNSDCVVAGWGTHDFNTKRFQTVLKSVELPLVDRPSCQRALRTTRLGAGFTLHESFLCAGGRRGQDACTGDGGSALACPRDPTDPAAGYVQAGIVSWGVGCGTAGLPGVYVDVRKLQAWIKEQVAALPL